jgi:hypothetical protein
MPSPHPSTHERTTAMRLSRHSIPPALGALAALALTAAPACAQSGLFTIGYVVSASPGGTGSFDVLLTAVGGDLSLGGFTAEPFLASPTDGVTFTAAGFNTSAPYVFPDSFDQDNGLTLTDEADDPFPNTDLIASDSDDQIGSAVTIANGETVGLAHVTYQVNAADAPGSAYTVDFNPGGTSLSDGTGAVSYPFTTEPGALTVGPAAAPEPSEWAALGVGGLGVGGLILRARKRRTRAL